MSESQFDSRWVQLPQHAKELEPTQLPHGFRAAGVAAGLKGKGELDLGVLISDSEDTISAARFTSNARVGAPVTASRAADTGRLRAIVANSGGSNTGDGERGLETAYATQARAGELLGVDARQVGVASTGVIGVELPRQPLLAGLERASAELSPFAVEFSRAIMTSDVSPKRICLELTLPSGKVRLAAQCKGAGMIQPRYATMFCFVETDAMLAPETIDLLTSVCVKRSFDRISVDGQLSTSDTVFVLAGGASKVTIAPESEDELLFGEAMDALMRQLALQIVRDGEGAKRVGRIVVRGDSGRIEYVARAIANSPLVKTALHGGDPNFGRILQAAGAAWNGGPDSFVVDLEIEGRSIVSANTVVVDSLDEVAPLVQGTEVEYVLTVPDDGTAGETEVFFSDLSQEYVHFNSAYTT